MHGFIQSWNNLSRANFKLQRIPVVPAVELAAIEKAKVRAKDQVREQEKIQADTAKIKAAGIANAQIEKARGEAETIRLKATAEEDIFIRDNHIRQDMLTYMQKQKTK